MNISLGRGGKSQSKKKKKIKSKNVLGDDGSSDDEPNTNDAVPAPGSRASVNQAIAREQEALRKRAQQVIATEEYDYDGAYESFHPSANEQSKKEEVSSQGPPEKKKSRYIGDLLQAANHRQRERELRLERKIAKEQELESGGDDKEQFVTAAYKRKLQERELWQAQEDEKAKQEELNDVTKQVGGAAVANFYGNFQRNVALGGEQETKDSKVSPQQQQDDGGPLTTSPNENNEVKSSPVGGMNFLDGFERAPGEDAKEPNPTKESVGTSTKHTPPREEAAMSARQQREEKVAQARIRYLERKRKRVQDNGQLTILAS